MVIEITIFANILLQNRYSFNSLFQNNHLDNIAHLEQTTTEKGVLYTNLVLILIGAIVLYVYFSINPFTQEEIDHLRRNANFTIIQP